MSARTAAMLEEDWQTWVLGVARVHGWRISHFRPARTARGWRTAVEGHAGFPDLVLARDTDVIIAELKKDDGRLTPDQQAWLDALGPIAHVWRPQDRDKVLATLSAPRFTRTFGVSHSMLVRMLRDMEPGTTRYLPPRLAGNRNGLVLTRYGTAEHPNDRPAALQHASTDTPGTTS